MKRDGSARDEVLAAVRRGLAAARARGESGPQVAREEPEATQAKTLAERCTRMGAVLRRSGSHVHEAASEADAVRALARILAELGVQRLFVSDSPLAARVAALAAPAAELVTPDAPREQLLEADVGLTCAQWGIAETGTLVLESEREQHRLASLLPPVHVALLPAASILGTLGEALARLSAGGAGAMSRAITFISGPSRTADIELRLVTGVHGPRVLHVVLLGADPTPERTP